MKDNLIENIICNFSRLDEKMKDNKKSNSSKRIKLFSKKFNGLTLFLFFLCLILMLPVIAQAASVTMTWNRNQEPDIAGYRIYYGTQSGQYNNSITVYDSATQPLQLSYTVAGLSEGTTYYFALKTFDQAGQESDYSVETSQNIPGGDGDEDDTGSDTTAGISLSIYSAPTTIGEYGQRWPDDMLPPVDENTVAVTSVDIDGDGIDEIAYLKKGPGNDRDFNLFIYSSSADAGGSYLIASDFWSPDGNTVGMAAVDIDGDGIDEIAYLEKGRGNERNFDLFIYSAPTIKGQHGVYLASDYWSPDGNTIGMAAVDIDGDGIDEIAYLKKVPGSEQDFNLFIYLAPTSIAQKGAQLASDYGSPDGNTIGMAAVDIDGDGIDEIAYLKKVPGSEQDFNLFIYLAPTSIAQKGAQLASDYWSPDGNTIGMAAVDIDGDGIDEMAYLKQH